MKYMSAILFIFAVVFLLFSFAREDTIVLTATSPSKCAIITTHTYWVALHADRNVEAFRIRADGEIWFEHKGGPFSGPLRRGKRFLTDSLETRYFQCFDLELDSHEGSRHEVHIFAVGGPLPVADLNVLGRILSALCAIFALLCFGFSRRQPNLPPDPKRAQPNDETTTHRE